MSIVTITAAVGGRTLEYTAEQLGLAEDSTDAAVRKAVTARLGLTGGNDLKVSRVVHVLVQDKEAQTDA